MPVVVAIGGVPLADAIELAQHAQKAGAALPLWPPVFGYRSRAGVMSYFRAVIESVSMPRIGVSLRAR
jgi:dihydrodipicolinate synthase/N-acetylneuraminate lyase